MSARTSRERWLWRATIGSGVLAALSYAGGPIACATKQVEIGKVLTPLYQGHEPALVLTRAGATGAAVVQRIERGTLIELGLHPGAGAATFECMLAGFDPIHRTILITSDGRTIEAVPHQQLQAITVLGGNPTGAYAGNGAIIGGLSGIAIGAALGAQIQQPYAGTCAIGFGILGGGLGTGIGSLVGATVAPDRTRTQYPLGPGGWQIGNISPWQPAATPMPANFGGTP